MPGRSPDADQDDVSPLVVLGFVPGKLATLKRLLAQLPRHRDWSFVLCCAPEMNSPRVLRDIARSAPDLVLRPVEVGARPETGVIHILTVDRDIVLEDDRFVEAQRPAPDETALGCFLASLTTRRIDRTFVLCLCDTAQEGMAALDQLQQAGGLVLHAPKAALSVPEYLAELCPVEAMPGRIAAMLDAPPPQPRLDLVDRQDGLRQVLSLLSAHRHVNIDLYKPAVIQNRLERRMRRLGLSAFGDYARLLRETPGELDALLAVVLSGATGFFRDADAFEALTDSVLMPLALEETDRPIRVWVPSCATGQEAYSIAIAMAEALEAAGSDRQFRLIATDLQPALLDVASAGAYPRDAVTHLPRRLVARYFEPEGDDLRIIAPLRRRLVFSVQDVMADPPLRDIDLVSCRNLLVYLQPEARAQALSMLHFALRPGGALFLGQNEHPGRLSDRFATVDDGARLFRKIDEAPGAGGPPGPGASIRPVAVLDDHLRAEAFDALLTRTGLSALLFSEKGEVLGDVGAARTLLSDPVSGNLLPEVSELIGAALAALRRDDLHPTEHRLMLRPGLAVVLRLDRIEGETGLPILLVSPELDPVAPGDPAAAGPVAPLPEAARTFLARRCGPPDGTEPGRIDALLETLGIGVAMLDRQGRITRLSTPLARLLDLGGPMRGLPVAALPLGPDFTPLRGLVDEVLREGTPAQMDGHVRGAAMDIRIFPGNPPDGAVLLFVPGPEVS